MNNEEKICEVCECNVEHFYIFVGTDCFHYMCFECDEWIRERYFDEFYKKCEKCEVTCQSFCSRCKEICEKHFHCTACTAYAIRKMGGQHTNYGFLDSIW